jgi:hypothetical protein
MVASYEKHADIVRWLIKEGANTQAGAPASGYTFKFTAASISTIVEASAEQTSYLAAKRTARIPAVEARYCGEPCQYAHWKLHKADCKRWSAKLKAKDK